MKNIIIEHYDQTYRLFHGKAYFEGTEDLFEFKIRTPDFMEWLRSKGMIGKVTVDSLDDQGNHYARDNDLSFEDYMEEYFDQSHISNYMMDNNIRPQNVSASF